MSRAEENWTKKVKRNNTKKKIWKVDMEIATLNKQKAVVRVKCNVSRHIYYQYFTFKSLR